MFHSHWPLAGEVLLLLYTHLLFLCCIVGKVSITTTPMIAANLSELSSARDLFDGDRGSLNLQVSRPGWTVAKSAEKFADESGLPGWNFTDQNGAAFRPQPGARFQVYVLGNRKISKATQRWGDDLAERLPPSCQVIRVLDLKGLIRLAAPLVVRRIRKQLAGKKIDVYLDWKGQAATRFKVRSDTPSIVCLGESGASLRVVQGRWNAERSRSIVDLYTALGSRGIQSSWARPIIGILD